MRELKKYEIEGYEKNGFLIVENLVEKELLNAQAEVISRCLTRFLGSDMKLANEKNLWTSPNFHEVLVEFRKKDSKMFGAFFDSLQSNIALLQLAIHKATIDISAKLLAVTPFDCSSRDYELRIDVPFDTRNRLDWHQDQSFFPANYLGKKCIGTWFPLNQHTPDMGALEVIPGSHKLGDLKSRSTKWSLSGPQGSKNIGSKDHENPYNVSEQPEISGVDIDGISKGKIAVDMNPGDVLFFHFFLLHQSGLNRSDLIRFTVINRLHVSTSEDFRPFRSLTNFNPHMEKAIQEKFEK